MAIEAGKRRELDRMFKSKTWVTVRRACEWLEISRATFYRYLGDGTISGVHRTPGGRIRITRVSLESIYYEIYRTENFDETDFSAS